VPLENGARPTKEKIKAMLAAYEGVVDELKVTHLVIGKLARSSELEDMWNALTGQSEAKDVGATNEAPDQSVADSPPRHHRRWPGLLCLRQWREASKHHTLNPTAMERSKQAQA
jgi:hypothetical protein